MRYFMLDHLNSISVLTNESGAVVERDFYDAWGRRRNNDGSDWSACPSAAPGSQITRGFTNQEELDSVCLVDLNARIYDPTIGRFLSADDVIPDQYGPQTLNRYSYVYNNPLSFTDPSGHWGIGGPDGPHPSSLPTNYFDFSSFSLAGLIQDLQDYFDHAQASGTSGDPGKSGSDLTQATSNKPEGSPIAGRPPQTTSGHKTDGTAADQNAHLGSKIDGSNSTAAARNFESGTVRLADAEAAEGDIPDPDQSDPENLGQTPAQSRAASEEDNAAGEAIAREQSDRDAGMDTRQSQEEARERANPPRSPDIDPQDMAGKPPGVIDKLARDLGLIPKGEDPLSGRGAYIDPETGKQRVLVHPNAPQGPHMHVNDAEGNRLDINGQRVPADTPAAHLPLGS